LGTPSEALQRAEDRFNRTNDLKRRDRRGRIKRFSQTPVGQLTTELFLGSLADYLDSKKDDKPPPPPSDELNERLGRLKDPYPAVALAILSPLLDNIMRGWKGMDDPSAEAKLAENMGKSLCDWLALQDLRYSDSKTDRRLFSAIRRRGRKLAWKHLQSEWSPPECVAAGAWMIRCASAMPYFIDDDRGFPAIAPEWQGDIDRIRADVLSRYLAMMPHLTPPPDWAGWWAIYDDRPRQPFVRDWRSETRTAIEATFASGFFPHADGVNALQRVPLRINQAIVPLVEKFADNIMNRKITTDDKGEAEKQRAANRVTVEDDLKDARWIGDQQFFLSYNCDKRGRINAIPRLNYQREDHVRALFEFANGLPLGDGLQWLEIYCANCEGSTDKERWAERRQWVRTNRDLIERIAADPEGTFDLWRDADKPFAFVAACLELAKAMRDPVDFVTRLPIGFDGSANGIQHLACLARDEEAAMLVNLIGFDVGSVRYPTEAEYRCIPEPGQRRERFKQAGEAFAAALKEKDSEEPQDVYDAIAHRVLVALRTDDNEIARAWCENLQLLNGRRRKLFKGAIMIYPYSGTDAGMADKIIDAHAEMRLNSKLQRSAALFLAKKLRQMCDEVLPGPAGIMNYIRDLAAHRRKQELVLEWRTATGFPVANRYQYSRIELVELTLDGIRARHEVANGAIDKFKTTKTLDSASPNFVHSLDAAHLIRTVLAANGEDLKDILTVHDCFACLAPHAVRFSQLIRRELLLLHLANPLAELRRANIGGEKQPSDSPFAVLAPLLPQREAKPPPPLPEPGDLDISKLLYGEYSFA
jgi:DNA-directed RNA polymerase